MVEINRLLLDMKSLSAAKPFDLLASAVYHSLGAARFADLLRWIAEHHSVEDAGEVEAAVRHLGISQDLNSVLSLYKSTLQSKPPVPAFPQKSKPEGRKKGKAARNESQVSVASSSKASFTNTDNVYTENPIDPENMQQNKIIDSTLSEHAGL